MSRKIIGVTVGTTMNPQRIAEKIETSTSLPMPTEADNGKVLQVEDGEWVAKELPTYDGEFLVTPSANNEQTLLTAGKYNDSNITVEKIPFSKTDTANTNGKTFSIG